MHPGLDGTEFHQHFGTPTPTIADICPQVIETSICPLLCKHAHAVSIIQREYAHIKEQPVFDTSAITDVDVVAFGILKVLIDHICCRISDEFAEEHGTIGLCIVCINLRGCYMIFHGDPREYEISVTGVRRCPRFRVPHKSKSSCSCVRDMFVAYAGNDQQFFSDAEDILGKKGGVEGVKIE